MSEPRRLLDDPQLLSREERAALRAGRSMAPSAELKRFVWGGLGPGLGAGTGTLVAQSGAVKGVWWLNIAKFVGVAALGTALVATFEATRTGGPSGPRVVAGDDSSPSASAAGASRVARYSSASSAPTDGVLVASHDVVAPTARKPHRVVAGTGTDAVVIPTTRASAAAPSVPSGNSEPAIVDDARAEVELVSRARESLRRGDARAALANLEQARVLFPNGLLGQEREVLTIEALDKMGYSSAAVARARTFLARHPRSPFAQQVRCIGAKGSD